MDWTKLNPLDRESVLRLAGLAVSEARGVVKPEARISHVGLRCKTLEEWQALLELAEPLGQGFMTYKPDGRPIPFIKLDEPVMVGADVLEYLELPAPKKVAADEPRVVVVFQLPEGDGKAMLEGGYDIRQQAMHAADFIARDNTKTA